MQVRDFMHVSSAACKVATILGIVFGSFAPARPLPAAAPTACQRAVVEGELNAGKSFTQPIGNGLKIFFQPIASGWILRVLPSSGPAGEHDYAELATPPYQSVTPLSISTDFSFRAQDAIGWNPRRFHFATSATGFHELEQAYLKLERAGTMPPAAVQAELASQLSHTSEAAFTILDSRLTPGVADQAIQAGAVASHFSTTAHTVIQEPDGRSSALGRLLWLRFRVDLDLPSGFRADPALHLAPRICAIP